MAESPKRSSGDFTKKVQRRLSRSKEKVLQRLGKTVETRDDQFDCCLQGFNDQQTDGNRMYKDLKNYINAVRDMREASRRLSQSLFDSYESDWAGEEDLGAIVEGEDLLWNDYEVKLLDQVVRTMESYVSQFPDVRVRREEKARERTHKNQQAHTISSHVHTLYIWILSYSFCRRKLPNGEENWLTTTLPMSTAKTIYEGYNNELKEELPVLYESRIGCYVSVFSAVSNLRSIFYKETATLNFDLQNVIKELQAQHPDKVFAVRGMQRYGSLKRRTLLSPKAWKSSFSEFHRTYSPTLGQRFSFRSPEKPRHSSLSQEGSSCAISSQSSIPEGPSSESKDLDAGSSHSQVQSPCAEEERAGKGSAEDGDRAEEEECQPPAEPDNKGDGEKAPASESSSELNNSCDSESLELQLSAVDDIPLHIDESDNNPSELDGPKGNGLENGEVSGLRDLSISRKVCVLIGKQLLMETWFSLHVLGMRQYAE
uniref:BAR domain-containing protein n=1 Tax=Mola mola TaxID=94237 RepID=A0A3Q3XHP7_MOLML